MTRQSLRICKHKYMHTFFWSSWKSDHMMEGLLYMICLTSNTTWRHKTGTFRVPEFFFSSSKFKVSIEKLLMKINFLKLKLAFWTQNSFKISSIAKGKVERNKHSHTQISLVLGEEKLESLNTEHQENFWFNNLPFND